MEERTGITGFKGDPATLHLPETTTEPDDAAEVEEEKEPQIPIKQLPVDGVCGGY